jgi:D-alanyl-D-alanine carboxypeptidase
MGKPTVPLMGQYVRNFLFLAVVTLVAACSGPKESGAAPYAAYVMDARTGETLYSDNADTRLHPASLTKMMTLYITFQEIERGNLSLDTMVTVSKNAAAQPPSRLGLKAGQKIQLRYLIRAAAVKSANDAAAAIGDMIAGNPEKFGARMTRTAKALGMNNTTFKNANGLTAKGHLSTAHDMSILGRHLFYDFPQFYNIFSRRSTDAGIATVANTNRKFLDSYEGADGIKTGYTAPAGFNLTASAQRNGVRIIATVFGGTSTPMRNAKMKELLDLGFRKAKGGGNAAPSIALPNADSELMAQADTAPDPLPEVEGGSAKTIRLAMAVSASPRPAARPEDSASQEDVAAADEAVAAMADTIAGALAEATAVPAPDSLEAQAVKLADAVPEVAIEEVAALETVPAAEEQIASVAPEQAPAPEAAAVEEPIAEAAPPQPVAVAAPKKAKRKAPIYDDIVVAEAEKAMPTEEVVTRVSTSGGKAWGVNVGRFNSHGEAERVLMKTLLIENATLGNSLRKIVQKSGGYDANFLGLSQDDADLACRRLQARAVQCFTMGP